MERVKLTSAQAEVLRKARSLIRYVHLTWTHQGFSARPEDVCQELSELLGESYDFKTGEVVDYDD